MPSFPIRNLSFTFKRVFEKEAKRKLNAETSKNKFIQNLFLPPIFQTRSSDKVSHIQTVDLVDDDDQSQNEVISAGKPSPEKNPDSTIEEFFTDEIFTNASFVANESVQNQAFKEQISIPIEEAETSFEVPPDPVQPEKVPTHIQKLKENPKSENESLLCDTGTVNTPASEPKPVSNGPDPVGSEVEGSKKQDSINQQPPKQVKAPKRPKQRGPRKSSSLPQPIPIVNPGPPRVEKTAPEKPPKSNIVPKQSSKAKDPVKKPETTAVKTIPKIQNVQRQAATELDQSTTSEKGAATRRSTRRSLVPERLSFENKKGPVEKRVRLDESQLQNSPTEWRRSLLANPFHRNQPSTSAPIESKEVPATQVPISVVNPSDSSYPTFTVKLFERYEEYRQRNTEDYSCHFNSSCHFGKKWVQRIQKSHWEIHLVQHYTKLRDRPPIQCEICKEPIRSVTAHWRSKNHENNWAQAIKTFPMAPNVVNGLIEMIDLCYPPLPEKTQHSIESNPTPAEQVMKDCQPPPPQTASKRLDQMKETEKDPAVVPVTESKIANRLSQPSPSLESLQTEKIAGNSSSSDSTSKTNTLIPLFTNKDQTSSAIQSSKPMKLPLNKIAPGSLPSVIMKPDTATKTQAHMVTKQRKAPKPRVKIGPPQGKGESEGNCDPKQDKKSCTGTARAPSGLEELSAASLPKADLLEIKHNVASTLNTASISKIGKGMISISGSTPSAAPKTGDGPESQIKMRLAILNSRKTIAAELNSNKRLKQPKKPKDTVSKPQPKLPKPAIISTPPINTAQHKSLMGEKREDSSDSHTSGPATEPEKQISHKASIPEITTPLIKSNSEKPLSPASRLLRTLARKVANNHKNSPADQASVPSNTGSNPFIGNTQMKFGALQVQSSTLNAKGKSDLVGRVVQKRKPPSAQQTKKRPRSEQLTSQSKKAAVQQLVGNHESKAEPQIGSKTDQLNNLKLIEQLKKLPTNSLGQTKSQFPLKQTSEPVNSKVQAENHSKMPKNQTIEKTAQIQETLPKTQLESIRQNRVKYGVVRQNSKDKRNSSASGKTYYLFRSLVQKTFDQLFSKGAIVCAICNSAVEGGAGRSVLLERHVMKEHASRTGYSCSKCKKEITEDIETHEKTAGHRGDWAEQKMDELIHQLKKCFPIPEAAQS